MLLPGYEEVGALVVWHRPIKEVVQSILAQPNLAPHMLWAPEMRYSGDTYDDRFRQFGEVNTTDHWWEEQANSPVGSTICPLLCNTDETCLTEFSGEQVVYPFTIAPAIVPGPIRARTSSMARQLIAYIPTDDPVGLIGPKDDASHFNMAVHHAVLKMIFAPVTEAMKGPGWPTICGDGYLRNIIPTLPSYPADFPEQGLFTACKGCGVCDIPDDEMGTSKIGNIRDPATTLNHLHIAGNILGRGDAEKYLTDHRLKYIFRPWWEGMERCNPHLACTPDVLHQIWQGIIKHLTKWIIVIIGEVEVDARVQRFARCHGSRYFKSGISGLIQLSGREHRQIATFLLAIVQGVPGLSVKDQFDLSSATRALIDFAYLAEYRQHDEDTLGEMQSSLNMWDKYKDVFIRLTWRDDLNLPKVHGIQHYIPSIRRVGSLKYLSTDDSEKSHIYVAKRPFESSNKRDPKGQMVTIYDRWDKIRLHGNWIQHLQWLEDCNTARSLCRPIPPNPFSDPVKPRRKNLSGLRLELAVKPHYPNVPMTELSSTNIWKCPCIRKSLKDFIYRERKGNVQSYSISRSNDIFLEFDKVDCWARLKFHNPSVTGMMSYTGPEDDSVECQPWRTNRQSNVLFGGRQDVVLINTANGEDKAGMSGLLLS